MYIFSLAIEHLPTNHRHTMSTQQACSPACAEQTTGRRDGARPTHLARAHTRTTKLGPMRLRTHMSTSQPCSLGNDRARPRLGSRPRPAHPARADAERPGKRAPAHARSAAGGRRRVTQGPWRGRCLAPYRKALATGDPAMADADADPAMADADSKADDADTDVRLMLMSSLQLELQFRANQRTR